jgi:hypothetical protein
LLKDTLLELKQKPPSSSRAQVLGAEVHRAEVHGVVEETEANDEVTISSAVVLALLKEVSSRMAKLTDRPKP